MEEFLTPWRQVESRADDQDQVRDQAAVAALKALLRLVVVETVAAIQDQATGHQLLVLLQIMAGKVVLELHIAVAVLAAEDLTQEVSVLAVVGLADRPAEGRAVHSSRLLLWGSSCQTFEHFG